MAPPPSAEGPFEPPRPNYLAESATLENAARERAGQESLFRSIIGTRNGIDLPLRDGGRVIRFP